MDKPAFRAPGSPFSPERGNQRASFGWTSPPGSNAGLLASPGNIPLFHPSPRRQGPPSSPTNPFSPGTLVQLFQSPPGVARTLPDAMRFDTPISWRLATGLFSPSPASKARDIEAGNSTSHQSSLQQLQWDALHPPSGVGADSLDPHAQAALEEIRTMLASPAKVGKRIRLSQMAMCGYSVCSPVMAGGLAVKHLPASSGAHPPAHVGMLQWQ